MILPAANIHECRIRILPASSYGVGVLDATHLYLSAYMYSELIKISCHLSRNLPFIKKVAVKSIRLLSPNSLHNATILFSLFLVSLTHHEYFINAQGPSVISLLRFANANPNETAKTKTFIW